MSCNIDLLVEASSKLSDDDDDHEMLQGDKENIIPNEHNAMSVYPSSNSIATCMDTSMRPIVTTNTHTGTSTEKIKYNGPILYCKARGMPIDHIGINAILQFEKGYDRVHGAELKCSHQACAKDGVKFRWCAHCNKAVAKRNFRKRHAHPELDVVPGQSLSPISNNGLNSHSFQNMNTDAHQATSIKKERTPSTSSNQVKTQEKSSQTMNHPISVPHTWVELYHRRPTGGSIQQQQEWLRTVMKEVGLMTDPIDQIKVGPKQDVAVDNNADVEMNVGFLAPATSLSFDPAIQAAKEEFSGNVPPRFVAFDSSTSTQHEGTARGGLGFRQHAQTMSLHVNTDLETLGSNMGSATMMLDSDGSFKIFSCTPRSFGSAYGDV